MFDTDRAYNAQNNRVWSVGRATAIRESRKFPPESHGLARDPLQRCNTSDDLRRRVG